MPTPISPLFDLTGRTALVTGGAKGLGLAMARALAEHGADIVLADIDDAVGEKAAAELAESAGVRTGYRHVDVTSPDAVDAVVADVVAEFGGIHILLNNAGMVIHQNLEDVTAENWRKVMALNLDGVFHVLQAVGRHMLERGSGSIINTGSMSGIIANVPQAQASYNASKAAVHNLTRSAALEWAGRGVRVNAIAPGYMKTELTREFFEAGGPQIDQWMLMTPMSRPGEPHELGGAAVYLASDASSFVTGSVLSIDGGYTAA
ncbi:3-oxoacyl-ACP reductase [Brachybacterium phenoliresistens]|uniref:3-oxoacyl-ACP reductase n=1 Tax=Brachybacterium phenoliresistens TaxID=396014 RepID=Z9JWD7_9MICO|nr:SDR family oxidoreductase [Brachybacterium phenoliresistens]EWS82072.1 3-oxoacyl-ACP reductase [Brachybacterium phenoliresistens]